MDNYSEENTQQPSSQPINYSQPQNTQQPPSQSQPNNPINQKTCIWAILGIIFAFLFPIAGLIFSIIALVKINKNPALKGKGLAIAGLIISIITTLLLPILVAVGAIAFFGVLNPQTLIPDSCMIGSGFSCNNHMVQEGKVTLNLRNDRGQTITTATASINEKNCVPEITDWNNGETKQFTCETTTDSPGNIYRGTIILKYQTNNGFDMTNNIEIVGHVNS